MLWQLPHYLGTNLEKMKLDIVYLHSTGLKPVVNTCRSSGTLSREKRYWLSDVLLHRVKTRC